MRSSNSSWKQVHQALKIFDPTERQLVDFPAKNGRLDVGGFRLDYL